MKRHTASTLLTIVFLTGFIVSSAPLQAKDHGCSTAITAGDWGFTDTGSIIGLGPFGAIGTFTLDAAGNVVGEQTNSVNGSVSHLTFTGSYTVNSDCAGSTDLDVFDSLGNKVRTSGLDLVFDDDVKEMRAIFTSVILPSGTSLPTVITLEARRLSSKNGHGD
jgi:hypothetical protein